MASKELTTPLQEQSSVYLNESMTSIQQKTTHQPVENSIDTPRLSSHWSRYFITELYGTWIATFIVDFSLYTLSGENYADVLESGWLYLSIGVAFGYFFGILICRDANLNIVFTLGYDSQISVCIHKHTSNHS